jgi:hypothetical protein
VLGSVLVWVAALHLLLVCRRAETVLDVRPLEATATA